MSAHRTSREWAAVAKTAQRMLTETQARAARAEQANRDLTRDRDRWKNLAESRSEEMLVDFDAAARACKAMRDAGAVCLILDPAPCLRSIEFMRVALTHFRDELAGGRR